MLDPLPWPRASRPPCALCMDRSPPSTERRTAPDAGLGRASTRPPSVSLGAADTLEESRSALVPPRGQPRARAPARVSSPSPATMSPSAGLGVQLDDRVAARALREGPGPRLQPWLGGSAAPLSRRSRARRVFTSRPATRSANRITSAPRLGTMRRRGPSDSPRRLRDPGCSGFARVDLHARRRTSLRSFECSIPA